MDINHKYPLTKTVMVRKRSCRYELYDVRWKDFVVAILAIYRCPAVG